MGATWTVRWFATDTGYRVMVRHGIRVVHTFAAESLSGEDIAMIRQQAAARAIELALEYRAPLPNVCESVEPL